MAVAGILHTWHCYLVERGLAHCFCLVISYLARMGCLLCVMSGVWEAILGTLHFCGTHLGDFSGDFVRDKRVKD